MIILTAASMACCHQKEKPAESIGTAASVEAGSTEAQDASEDRSKNSENDLLTGESVLIGDFTVLSQLPELPTGCEVTSLTMALNYAGIPADKCDIADNYLEKGGVGEVDFRVAFEGDPRDEASYGCYAPVIVKAANQYLSANGYSMKAVDLTGTDFDALLSYPDDATPVIIWGTVDCEEPVNRTTWIVDDVELKWYSPEHCMVLLGYDDQQVAVADPLKGEIVKFDRELFKARYNDLFQQAVVIVSDDDPSGKAADATQENAAEESDDDAAYDAENDAPEESAEQLK